MCPHMTKTKVKNALSIDSRNQQTRSFDALAFDLVTYHRKNSRLEIPCHLARISGYFRRGERLVTGSCYISLYFLFRSRLNPKIRYQGSCGHRFEIIEQIGEMREAEEVQVLEKEFGEGYEEEFEPGLEGRTTILAMTKSSGDLSCPDGIVLTRPTPVPSRIVTPVASKEHSSTRPTASGAGEDPVVGPPQIGPSAKTKLYSDTGSRSDMLASMALLTAPKSRGKSHETPQVSLARLATSAEESAARSKPLSLRSISPGTKATDTEGQIRATGRHGIGRGEEIPLMRLRRGAMADKSDRPFTKVKKPWLDRVLAALCVPCTL